MKPAPFKYHAPTTVDAMVALLAEFGDDGKVIAGGQSVRGSGRYRDPPLGELPGHIRASGR